MKRLFQPIFVLAIMAAMTACTSDEPVPANDSPGTIELTPSEKAAANASTKFNTKFFQAVCAEQNPESNVITSPVSASFAMSMVANACDDAARESIVNTLGCSDIDALNSLHKKYLEEMGKLDRNTEIYFANSIWYKNGYTLNEQFRKIAADYYQTENFTRDFANKNNETLKEINSWISDKTKGNIPAMLDDVSPLTSSMIINALYFYGKWVKPFDLDLTKKDFFYGSNGATKVDMMHELGRMEYGTGAESYESLKLYFGNKSFCIVLVLPEDGYDINEVIASDEFADIDKQTFTETNVNLFLPRFKIEPRNIDIITALHKTGISTDINLNALFDSHDGSKVLQVIQSSTIEFNESGAKATSATVTDDITSTGPTPEEVTMKFNRPFAYMIFENSTGVCIQAGKISNLQ